MRKNFTAAALLLVSIAAIVLNAGCGGDEEDIIYADEENTCTTTMDCPFGTECVDGKCIEEGNVKPDHGGTETDTGNITDDNEPVDENGVTGDNDPVEDNSQSVDDTNDSGETPDGEYADDYVESDEITTPDDEEVPDEDTAGGKVCSEHADCPDDRICYNSYCIDPFINKWKISDINLCLTSDTPGGDNWDPWPATDPEPYVIAYLNGGELFTTSFPDGEHCAVYDNEYSTYFIRSDVLEFVVWDDDVDSNDKVGTATFSPLTVENFRSEMLSVRDKEGIKNMDIKLTPVK